MDKISIRLTINYATLVGGVVLILVSVAGYIYLVPETSTQQTAETIKEIIGVIGVEILLLTLIYTALNVHQINRAREEDIALQKRLHEEDIILRKRLHADSYIKAFRSPEFSKYNLGLRAVMKELSSAQTTQAKEEIHKKIKSNDELSIYLGNVLNFFEEMAQSVSFGLADEEYLKCFFRSIAISYYNGHKWLIKERQDKFPRAYAGFEELAVRWERNEKVNEP